MKKDFRELPDNEYNVLFELILLPMIRESSADSDLTCYREINEVDLAKSLSVPEGKVTEAFEQLLIKGLITVEIDTKPRKKIDHTRRL